MLSQQTEDRDPHLELRVATLEIELAQMRQILAELVQKNLLGG